MSMLKAAWIFLSTVLLILVCCTGKGIQQGAEDEQALQKIHENDRVAHFGRDASALVAQFSADMISVNRGTIRKTSSPESDMEGFQSYFNSG